MYTRMHVCIHLGFACMNDDACRGLDARVYECSLILLDSRLTGLLFG